MPERYGKFATWRLDESRLLCGSQSTRRAPVSSQYWVVASVLLKMRFPPFCSEGEARGAQRWT